MNFGHGRPLGLKMWAKRCLLRHGGYFAKHPVFAFLVYNILIRSGNRRISMQILTKPSFNRFQTILPSLTPSCLERAAEEIKRDGTTKDKEIKQLLGQLTSFGFLSAFSTEARLLMRRRIKAGIIRHGLPAIWFTINLNDLTNPIRIHLSIARSTMPENIQSVLRQLESQRERLKLAVEDPVSVAIFFYHEISVFCRHFVRIGEPSAIGQASFYFGAVETNERHMLHLHGMIWLQGNLGFGDMASLLLLNAPEEQASRQALWDSILKWCDSVFVETLDMEAAAALEVSNPGKRVLCQDVLSEDPAVAWASLQKDANRCAKGS